MVLDIIDFDEINNWSTKLTAALRAHLPDSIARMLQSEQPEFVEDARDLLFDLTDRESIVDATLTWIRSVAIAAYHGSRLIEEEIASIRTEGLIPLKAGARRQRLMRALSPHPRWNEVVGKLDVTINDHGPGGAAGRREGQVHLTLSAAGLLNRFNHYLTHGAEFDQRVAYTLLGPDGKQLLAHDGKATIIRVAVPGARALEAAHPHFSIDDLRARGDLPNLVSEFLEAWSFRLAHPEFQSRSLKIDCGLVFRETVPATWIADICAFENDKNGAAAFC